MKKILRTSLVASVAVGLLSALTACGGVKGAVYTKGTPVKVGLICLHDTNSTYDKNFIDAMTAACADLGATKVAGGAAIVKTGVPETNECYEAAKDLVKQGCNFIFADSFGHQEFMLKAAREWPTVQFAHATGTNAKTANLPNYHNGFASIYEGRYLAGVAAGCKLVEMYNAGTITEENLNTNGNFQVGYVGAFTYAEVISGYTSWYLGVKNTIEEFTESSVDMDVRFTGSWYDAAGEQSAAQQLITDGALLVSQHADSMGAPGECEAKKVPNVSYNIATEEDCPTTFVAYSKIDWAPYYKNIINGMFDDTGIAGETNSNWTGTMATGSVKYGLTSKTDVLSQESREYVAAQEAAIKAGTLKVFDVNSFTVTVVKEGDNQKNVNATVDAEGHLTSYMADTDGDYAPDTEAITTVGESKFFNESVYCSAPYFDCQIDGIALKNVKF